MQVKALTGSTLSSQPVNGLRQSSARLRNCCNLGQIDRRHRTQHKAARLFTPPSVRLARQRSSSSRPPSQSRNIRSRWLEIRTSGCCVRGPGTEVLTSQPDQRSRTDRHLALNFVQIIGISCRAFSADLPSTLAQEWCRTRSRALCICSPKSCGEPYLPSRKVLRASAHH